MNWAVYPEYAESGVPWLGTLPSHWTTPHLGHIVECLDAIRIPLNASERAEVPGDVPYWGANGVLGSVDRPLVDGELVLLGEDGAPFTDRTKEKAFYVNEPIWPNNHIHVLRSSAQIMPQFLAYALNATEYSWFIEGSTREKLTQTKMLSIPIAMPPLAEQCLITGFLDRETAKIDALIDKQEQLIATLREESDALWSAELKRLSGLAPSMPIQRVIESIVDGPFGSSLTSSHYSADGARVIRLGNIGVNEFKDDDRAYIPLDYATSLSTHEVKKGDVVVAGLGDDKMPLGRAALVPPIGPAIVKADCYRVRPRAELVRADYLAWALSAPPTRDQIALLARGATRARLNTSVIKEVEIPVPALRDQAEAVSRAREHLSKIDFLVSKATQLSDTLREYRSALITNAVTGKIDVREAM